jgi:hypothetical protein
MGLRFSKNGIATFRAVNTPDYDADAQLFITATGISGTNANAITQLVINLKNANIWTKMKAVYPMVGGTATSCKFNLKDPRDLDVAFRLAFTGGGTFSANGYQPNGTNAYADTFFIPSTNFSSVQNVHISVYQTLPVTISNAGGSYIGVSPITALTLFGATTSIIDCRLNSNGASVYTLSYASDGKGLFTTTKNSSTSVRAFRNGILAGTVTAPNGTNTVKMYIGARNYNGTANSYESTIQKFISFGDGLTDAESLAFYTAVQAFNTTLGRQV